jgi:hypothetical protein
LGCWLTYRRGSFRLKEKFHDEVRAAQRAADLSNKLCYALEIVPETDGTSHPPHLADAIEMRLTV